VLKQYFTRLRGLHEIIFMVCILILSLSGNVANATVIGVSTSNVNPIVGESINVDLHISGLSTAPGASLSAFDLDILFDDNVFAFTGFSFIDPGLGHNQLELPEAGAFSFDGDVIDLGLGLLDAYGISGNSDSTLDAAQANEFRFLGLTFTAIAEAAYSSISIDLSDPFLFILDSTFDDLNVSYLPAEVDLSVSSEPSSVPEPSTLLLLAVGILLLLTNTWKRFITLGR